MSSVWGKVPEGSTRIFGDTRISDNTVRDSLKQAPMPKTSTIRFVVTMQYRLVTDGRTNGQTQTTGYTALA